MCEYERQVQNTWPGLGRGRFGLEIDGVASKHMISHHAIEDIVPPELQNFPR
jgi:hypothetical protein